MKGKNSKAERRLQELYVDNAHLMQILCLDEICFWQKVVEISSKMLKVQPTYARLASDPLSGHSQIH